MTKPGAAECDPNRSKDVLLQSDVTYFVSPQQQQRPIAAAAAAAAPESPPLDSFVAEMQKKRARGQDSAQGAAPPSPHPDERCENPKSLFCTLESILVAAHAYVMRLGACCWALRRTAAVVMGLALFLLSFLLMIVAFAAIKCFLMGLDFTESDVGAYVFRSSPLWQQQLQQQLHQQLQQLQRLLLQLEQSLGFVLSLFSIAACCLCSAVSAAAAAVAALAALCSCCYYALLLPLQQPTHFLFVPAHLLLWGLLLLATLVFVDRSLSSSSSCSSRSSSSRSDTYKAKKGAAAGRGFRGRSNSSSSSSYRVVLFSLREQLRLRFAASAAAVEASASPQQQEQQHRPQPDQQDEQQQRLQEAERDSGAPAAVRAAGLGCSVRVSLKQLLQRVLQQLLPQRVVLPGHCAAAAARAAPRCSGQERGTMDRAAAACCSGTEMTHLKSPPTAAGACSRSESRSSSSASAAACADPEGPIAAAACSTLSGTARNSNKENNKDVSGSYTRSEDSSGGSNDERSRDPCTPSATQNKNSANRSSSSSSRNGYHCAEGTECVSDRAGSGSEAEEGEWCMLQQSEPQAQ